MAGLLTIWLLAVRAAEAACGPSPDLTVCPSGCTHTDVATAVADAGDEDVICVEPGVHPQRVLLDGARRVRVEGSAPGVVVTLGSGNEIVRVQNGGELELVDLAIDGTGTARRCVSVASNGSLRLEGATVSGCTHGVDGAAVYLEAGTTLYAEDSVFSGNGSGGNSGGNVYANQAARVDLVRTTIAGGRSNSGAALRLNGTATWLYDVIVDDHQGTGGRGGAVQVSGGSLVVDGGTFSRSFAGTDGGCISLESNASLDVLGTLFDGCDAEGNGGAIYNNGTGNVTLAFVTVRNSSADVDLSGSGSGGALYSNNATVLSVTDAWFEGNYAEVGGAIYAASTDDVDLLRSHLCLNESDGNGGAVWIGNARAGSVLGANAFQSNLCGGDGGGLYLLNSDDVVLRNNAFLDNDCGTAPGTDGDGLYVSGGDHTLVNNVVAFHTGEGLRRSSGTLASDYNLWFGNGVDATGLAFGGNELLGVDPQFAAWTADGVCNDGLWPAEGSPLIDAGDPALLDVDGSRSDLGPYGGPDGPVLDVDQDGYRFFEDCDDTDPDVYPGAPEVPVDGRDGDCDGFEICYADTDGDGYGTAATVASEDPTCLGAGVSIHATDCAPSDPRRHPGAAETPGDGIDQDCDLIEHCYQDVDGDLYGSAVIVPDADLSCTDDAGQSHVPTDCDDGDPNVHPDATEVVANGVDESCDGLERCYVDADLDAYGIPTTVTSTDTTCTGPGLAQNPDDCDDGNDSRYPGATEIVANGTDEDCTGGDTCWIDGDGDGYGHPTALVTSTDLDCADGGEADDNLDCDDVRATTHPFATETPADGVDADCDGRESCYRDGDLDGHAGATTVAPGDDLDCTDPGEFTVADDCDDGDARRFPGNPEVVANGVDEDCDGGETCWNDGDGDGWGAGTVWSPDTDCAGPGEAVDAGDCADGDPTVHPGAAESVADGVDQDCDGRETCFVDLDRDGHGQPSTTTSTALDCLAEGVAPAADDCDDARVGVHPGAGEVVADGIDQDCDTLEWCWADTDRDGYGSPDATVASADLDCADPDESALGTDCDDGEATVHPGVPEVTSDGVDGDCDGTERCYLDLDGDGYGRTTTGLTPDLACAAAGFADDALDCNDLDPASHPGAPEVADDGVDQDCSGTDAITCWQDADQDGYGSALSVLAADGRCDLAQAEAEVAGDCNDGEASIRPLADEVRGDGIDQDCWGGDLVDCYVDDDDDGYGGYPPEIAVPPSGDCATDGMAVNVADCNDADPAVHPGAVDPCGDGFDADCSGADDDDGDGLPFDEEAVLGTDDCLADTDFDLVDDGIEVVSGTDPVDGDSDDDGLLDGAEYGGAYVPVDTDGDGRVDPLDDDDDDDTVPTAAETAVLGGDADGDDLPNHLDPDDDDDTLLTWREDPDGDGDPRTDDTDGDGLQDWVDPDDDDDGLATADEVSVGASHLSADTDGDTVPDLSEWGTGIVARDTDQDGAPDVVDPDDDDDHIDTVVEGTGDPDGDGIPNHRDDDSDGDGKADATEGWQDDTDLDGVPDWLDPDDADGEAGDVDQDGLVTRDERALGTLSFDPDTDGDGVADGVEAGDPTRPFDTDGDDILDVFDLDDDGDGVETRPETGIACPDGSDFEIGYNQFGLLWQCADGTTLPTPEYKDTDEDGAPNYVDPDDDGDGILTANEDTDGDGDWFDDDADGDGVPDFDDRYAEDGPLGDLDGDGVPNRDEDALGSNPLSADTDLDTVGDAIELPAGDSDLDGIDDWGDPDDDGDGWATRIEGQLDLDGDAVPNYLDDDADGDGVADRDEPAGDQDCDGVPDLFDATRDARCAGPPDGAGRAVYARQGCGCAAGGPGIGGQVLALALLGAVARRRRSAERAAA